MPFVPDQPARASRFVPDAQPVATAEAQEPGFLDQMKRQAGLGARALYQGVTDLAGIPLDAAAAAMNFGNRLLGSKPYEVTLDDGTKVMRDGQVPLPSQQREEAFTALGLPEPGSPEERIANMAMRGMTGGVGLAKAASQAPGAIAAIMAQRPGLQAVSGATGGASSATAGELGAGPIGQLAAGLVGGGAPALATPRVPVAGSPANQARAAAAAQARATPGVAAAENVVSANPEVRVRSGHSFGHVGPDESAGLNPTRQAIAARGRELGFGMTPGQATGSRALQQLEAKLESQPMTSGPFHAIREQGTRAMNRAAAAAIGERADVVDSNVLGRAADRLGQVFESVADEVPRQIEPRQFVSFLSGLQDETRGLVSGLTSNPLVEDLVGFATQGGATGKQLSSLSSKIGKAAYKNMSTQGGDRDLGIALYRVKDYVDDLIRQGLSDEAAETFDAARGQYRNLMLLTQRVGVVNPSTGDVSGRSLANLLQSKDRRGFTYGENRSPMYDAARFSQAFAPIVGDSGTATRTPLTATEAVASIPFNLATRLYTSSPAINLATRAQAGTQSAANLARALQQPLGPEDIPYAGATSQAGSKRDEKRRRAIAKSLQAQ